MTDLKRAEKCQIFDENGSTVLFSSLFPTTSRFLIIFIRHFFCGNCQEYVKRLNTTLPPSKLPSDLTIKIIGCGASTLISSYKQLTNCQYEIYADPNHKLYDTFGMHKTLSLGSKSPEYIQHSLITGAIKSVYQGLKRIPSGDVMSAGDLNINGGEFLFIKDITWEISWCHRMENSRDHTEVDELVNKLI